MTIWKCDSKSSCYYKSINGYCSSPDKQRRVCKDDNGKKFYHKVEKVIK
jgi:hypothetical protein